MGAAAEGDLEDGPSREQGAGGVDYIVLQAQALVHVPQFLQPLLGGEPPSAKARQDPACFWKASLSCGWRWGVGREGSRGLGVGQGQRRGRHRDLGGLAGGLRAAGGGNRALGMPTAPS